MQPSCASRWIIAALLLGTLSGCHSLFGKDSETEKAQSEGKRISVLEVTRKVESDKDVSDIKPSLSKPVANKNWPQEGYNPEHNIPTLAFSDNPDVVWHADIGHGSNGDYKLLSRPVASQGKIFTLDARGQVKAFETENGDNLWRFDTTPEDRDNDAMGGGLGVAGDVVYVTTGFGEVLALRTADGAVIWRKMLSKPLRAAPTISKDRIYVVSIDNELTALSTRNGEVLWHHNGIAESATLMGASSPAAADDSVVVAYSSGEIFNLRAQNGRMAWTDLLAVPAQVGALPAIADIRGLPVMDKGRVLAVSHSGRTASIDLRTGDRVWEADVGGINTPFVAGDAVFLISNESELIAMTRERGRIIWIQQLPRLEDPTDRDSTPIFWWGPIAAGNYLWATNSLGHLVAFAPENGSLMADSELADSFFVPPIVANNTMFVLSDKGQLMALR
ncbi:MAG: PQQ-binding-like beta-propeller repeat protein [Alphaproteobacteria bacterium]|nr:PQQ-binding-like beta-propeller repeat protein [Alphaproteobacteria bacterium]